MCVLSKEATAANKVSDIHNEQMFAATKQNTLQTIFSYLSIDLKLVLELHTI